MRNSRVRSIATFLGFAMNGLAYSSLVIGPGLNTATMKVPAVAPFTSLGDYRVEFRIHDWGNTASRIFSWASTSESGSYLDIHISEAGEVCAYDRVDILNRQGVSCANTSGHADVVVRVQRLGALPTDVGAVGSFWLEAWDADGTPLSFYCGINGANTSAATGCPIKETRTKDWSGQAGYIGNPQTAAPFSLAWLKWFSTTVEPRGVIPQESTPSDLADWRFEGNTTNEASGGYGVSLGSFKTTPTYSSSPAHPPVCAAGPPQTYRAGFPAKLEAGGSQALSGNGSLSYLWQQLEGPTEVQWTEGRETAHPWVSGTASGSYVFQLTVTDSGGQSNTCNVEHGFVATDDNGVVITGNPAVDTLLGPMVRSGANPWPWFDNRHKAEADMQTANLDKYYPAWWDVPATGTIIVTAGSKTVAGAETRFSTDFCQGPDNPTTPKTGAQINIWYPNSSIYGHGVRMHAVASCQSDTQLTLSAAWGNDVADCAAGGCSYALWGGDGVWSSNSIPANFYDAVAGFYAAYYRTGLEEYRTAARTLADRFWMHQLDSGTVCAGKNGMGGCLYNQRWAPRNIALLGMVLRALDGRPDMWDGLHTIIGFYRDYYLATGCPTCYQADVNWGLWDIREEAYHMAMASYGALYSPDAGFRAACKAALSNAMNKLWNVTKAPDGSWQQMYYAYNSWGSATVPATTVTLRNGSAEVTGAGTTWPAAVNGGRVVFTPDSGKPATRDGQENTYYTITYVDGQHLTLERPYEGATGTHGWIIGTTQATGWGVQPFIEGILGLAFEFTAAALADADPANAARARDHNASVARWQRDYGFRLAVKGMQYFAGTVDCMPPIPESATWCTAKQNASQARTLAAESLRSVMLGYARTGDATLRDFADVLYNAMYAKPGTCPGGSALCVPDGDYITDLNDVWGYYMYGTPPTGQAHKWFGMFFGIGAGSGWPAYRAGGPKPVGRRPVRVGFDLQSVAGAGAVRVTSTSPDGTKATAVCTSSPCTVDIDDREGDHIFRLDYLSPSGTVLASGRLPAVMGRRPPET